LIPRLYIVDDEAPARARLTTLLSDIAADCPHQLVGQAGNAQAALDGIFAANPDVLLLDIQMPGMNGVELAGHLAAHMQNAPSVIFITAYDSYALKAFEVHAIDYLLKPVRAARLADAIRRAVKARTQEGRPQSALTESVGAIRTKRTHFSVQERGRVLLIPVADVLYFKAELKYVTMRTGQREFLLEESLLSIEHEVGERFIRIHRNTLVARDAIVGVERGILVAEIGADGEKAMESWQVILRDIDERLPISRRQWPIVKAIVNRG